MAANLTTDYREARQKVTSNPGPREWGEQYRRVRRGQTFNHFPTATDTLLMDSE